MKLSDYITCYLDLYQKILTDGRLCMSKDKENKLYIGLIPTDPKIPSQCIVYNSDSNRVLSETVSFLLGDNVPKVESIYDNILKPFFDEKTLSKFQKPADWFNCINKFVSYDKLFMYILKPKYDKGYFKFMESCKSNMDKINWNAQDGEGNTMLHYVIIMDKYPDIACDIIQHIKESDIIPLRSVLRDGIINNKSKIFNCNIIRNLINAGATLLKPNDSETYVWEGRDQIFCVLTREPNTLLVAPKYITKTNEGDHRICCILKEPPECHLYKVSDLIANLPKNLLELVLKFPCFQIQKCFFTNKHCNTTPTLPDGTLYMHYIVGYGSKELVKFMFDEKIDCSRLDKSNNSLLHTAIRKRRTDNAVVVIEQCSTSNILDDMLKKQNDSKETPLDLVIKEKLFFLITTINTRRPELFCIPDTDGNYLFHRAVQQKSEELLKVLTEQANLRKYIDSENTNQYTPLMLCVQKKFVEGFKLLKNTKKCRIHVRDTEGNTLLHLAIMYFEKEILSELLQVIVSDNEFRQIIDRGTNIPKFQSTTSPKYPGLTPLLLSLKCNQFVAARLLIQNHADIHTLDCEGRTFNSYLIDFVMS